jgi:hypothetical protein
MSRDLAMKRIKSMRRMYSHHRNQPVIINMRVPSEESLGSGRRQKLTPRDSFAPETTKQMENVISIEPSISVVMTIIFKFDHLERSIWTNEDGRRIEQLIVSGDHHYAYGSK